MIKCQIAKHLLQKIHPRDHPQFTNIIIQKSYIEQTSRSKTHKKHISLIDNHLLGETLAMEYGFIAELTPKYFVWNPRILLLQYEVTQVVSMQVHYSFYESAEPRSINGSSCIWDETSSSFKVFFKKLQFPMGGSGTESRKVSPAAETLKSRLSFFCFEIENRRCLSESFKCLLE